MVGERATEVEKQHQQVRRSVRDLDVMPSDGVGQGAKTPQEKIRYGVGG